MSSIDLKQRLQESRILIVPGIADTLGAVLAENAGFEAVFLSGSAMAYTHLGRPDIGLLSLGEVTSIAARISERVDIPIFIDADSGFGNAYHVYRSVRALERAGASCIQIEDQVHDQDPNDIGNRPVIPQSDMQTKLRSALDARRDESTLISARSDAVFSEGVDAALERAAAYAESGADLIFVEGLSSKNDRDRLVALIDSQTALLFNTALPKGAKAPDIAALQTEGYSVALAPTVVVGAAAKAAEAALEKLAAQNLQPASGVRPAVSTPSATVADAVHGSEFLENFADWDKNKS